MFLSFTISLAEHATSEAMQQFFDKVDKDPEWFPGKHSSTEKETRTI